MKQHSQVTLAQYKNQGVSFEDWTTDDSDDELLDMIQQYSEEAIEKYDIEVDLEKIVNWELMNSKRKSGEVHSYKLALTADPSDRVEDYGQTKDDLEGVERFDECIIRFSRLAYDAHTDEEAKKTIRHELIHVEEVQKGLTYSGEHHGRRFERRADDVDTTKNCNQFVPYDYAFICEECGETVDGRFRDCPMVKKVRNNEVTSRCCRADMRVEE